MARYLGEYLIDAGDLTMDQVENALEEQARLRAQGVNVRLGELLIQNGYLSSETLEQALERQRREQGT